MRELDIAWRRPLIEGTAILLSILLALVIDAWWQDGEQLDLLTVQLQTCCKDWGCQVVPPGSLQQKCCSKEPVQA
jgi:hypothetical protein